ncbi:SdiA-regulated domain-containing protein [Prosthecobacter sp.]
MNTGNPVFVDEYSADGTLVQSIALPTTVSGANKRLVSSGTASSEGLLTRSADGQYLILTGYDVTPPAASSLSSTTSAAVNRVIGRVNAAGTVDTSTALTDYASATNPRCAVSLDGSKFWLSGGNGGVRLATLGATTSTDVSTTVTNLRQLGIEGGQLFVTTSSGTAVRLGTVGTGLPETTGQTITNLTGIPTTGSPYAFFFADLDVGVAGLDTVYIADDINTTGIGGVRKFSLVGSTWTANGIAGAFGDAYRGLTGSVNAGTVTLYATRKGGFVATGGGELVSIVDATGYNATITATPTLLATAATNTAFRGVVFAPAAPVTTPTVTIAATDASAAELGTDTGTFRITRTGDTTNALSVSYTLTTGAGQAVAADYTPALTGTATIAATQSFVDVTITPVDDFVLEGGETVALTLTDTVDYDLGATTTASITITDDETNIDLSRYVRVGRYDLPEPTRTTPPSGNLLGQEASGVAYNWDTDTLFIVGDGGTSVTEVTKAGALVSSMTLSGNGNDFLDTEGITYIGGGQFVLTEERVRQAVKFTYVAGGTLTNATAERVKLGTTIGNIGLEGLSYDPQTSGFLFAKESDPQGLFQTTIDFTAGTASNGSAATVNSTNLFTPALASLNDMSDVYAFSNLAAMTGQAQSGNLLILSQESGLIRHVDRSGNIQSTLTLVADAGNPLTIQNQTHEGVTMDREGRIYVVSENGGGDIDHPQLWVFAPAAVVNTAPTAIVLSTASTTIPENTSTAAAVKMANFTVTDADGVGVNSFSVSGTDAADFQVIGTALYLKAGTVMNGTTKPTYSVTVNVDDTSVGTTPDASANFTLTVTPVMSGSSAIRITEVAPWSSTLANSAVGADWFELTNTGTTALDITGWKMNDSAASFGSAGPLNGITSIAAGESVIFVDGSTKPSVFTAHWFGSNIPSGFQIGYYGGPGLSTGGDSVTIYDSLGTLLARVDFGVSPNAPGPFGTFDNSAGLNNATVTALGTIGQNGAFTASASTNEIGSPGTATPSTTPLVSITATDANAAEASTDSGTFRISRTGSTTLAMDVLYGISTGSGQATSDDYTPALGTTATIPAGASFVEVTITPVDDSSIEGSETLTMTLGDTGSYDVGSPASAMVTITDNDVNLPPSGVAFANTVAILSESANIAADIRVADITVTDDGNGTNTLSVSGTDAASFSITGTSLYLKAGTALSFATKPSYSVTVNVDDTTVGITPDLTANFNLAIAQAVAPGALVITEVHSSGSSATYAADWFELQNVGTTDLTITGWKMDDNSNGTPSTTQVALRGLTVIPAGKSAVFFEGLANGSTDATLLANFCTAWFGSSTPPSGVLIGAYGGTGVGMSGTADALNIFDAAGNRITGVAFGAATVGTTFDNKTAALGSSTLPLPIISTLSVIGTNGAFRSAGNAETGSPGSTVTSSYFPQSVASGDPRSSSVVLWTRVLDGHTAANREVSLHISKTGTIADVGTTAALGGTNVWTGGPLTGQSAHDGVLKVKVGSLSADTTYYYQFTYNGQRSPVGRTKTAPAAGSTRTVKYAAINCNDFVGRYFNVLRQLAEREQNSIDFVLNLGDYVYETTGDPSFQTSSPERAMVFSNPAEAINLGSGNYAAQSIGNYRDIYKTIRQDAQLKRVHELFPMISIWDDHEFSDDNWKDNATYFDGKVNEQQTNRKKNGEQAWMEFLPTERGLAATGAGLEIDSTDLYPNTVIYDAFNFGTNLDLILTDIRTNRADHLIPEDAIPSGIPMTETNVIATLAAANGLDVPTFTAAVWPSIRNSFAQYVNIDDSAYAAVKGVYKAIMAASANTALAALPAGQTAITTGAAYADAQVVGLQDANFINQAFVAAGQTAPFDAAALAAMPRGLSYYLLGKTSVFSDFGSRYQVVNQTFQLFAGYTYQAFIASSGAIGRDQAFYNSAQQAFLATALANSTAAGNKWRVVASSTPYTPIKLELGDLPTGVTLPNQGTIGALTIPASLPAQFLVEFLLNADEPAGFPQFRQGMIDLFAQHDAIIVSGDIHAELIGKNNASNGQKVVDFTVPSAASSEFRGAVSGAFSTVEALMTPSVQQATGQTGPFAFDATQKQAVINATDAIIKHNTPEMFQADTAAHGYTVFTAGPSAFNADYQKINVSEIDDNLYALSPSALNSKFSTQSFAVSKTGTGASTDLAISEVDFTLQVLHYYGESGLLGIQTAPIMGAMIDRFDDQYANTVVIGEGDSFIPGPWLVAGADPAFNSLLHTTAQVYSGNNGALGVAGTFNATATASTAVPFARADIAIMNAFGTTVSALGNHEFDLGSPVLASAIYPATTTGTSAVGNWVGAKFPHITANLDFSADSSLRGRADISLGGVAGTANNAPNVNAITSGTIANLEVTSVNMQAKIAPYAIKTINGQRIGFVGASTFDLVSKSSPNGTVPKDDANAATSDLQEVAAYLQGAVNSLQALGVTKIIQVDQLDTLQRNKDLAPLVSGIDIVIAGGGHERMGDATDVPVGFNGHDADFIADAYPIVATGADGRPVLIVTTDTEYTYLGRLVADFDADGTLIVPNLNPVINGAYASTEANLQTAYATANSAATIIASSTMGSQVKTIVDAINTVVVAKDRNVYGYTNVYLEGDRVFGRTQEVNLGNITADANAWKARSALGLGLGDAVFSLKNGGGIRASLGSILGNGAKVPPIANSLTDKPAKGISQLDIENALRFDNKLMVFDVTPQGLLNILNYAAGLSSGPTVQSGGYAQVGNIRFSYNTTALPNGSRVRSAALVNEAGQITARIVENGVVLAGAPSTIKCVALSFTANGGDSYPIKYLNPPTNTTVNTGTSNFRLLLTNGGLSDPIARNLDFTAASTYTSLGITAADVLGEQKAFQDFLAARHPNLATAYNIADTSVAQDTRVQQLAFRTDTVLSGPATFAAWLAQNGFTGSAGGDTDNDGIPDSLEYFFNANPNNSADRDNLPTVVLNGGDLEFRFTYLNSTVFPAYLQSSEDLVNWVNATAGVDYEVITETVSGAETSVRFRIFTSPVPTQQGPFTYLAPFTADVDRGVIDKLTITNHGMVGAGRLSGDSYDSFGETMGAASGLSITDWSYNSVTGQFNGTFNVLPDRGYNSGTIFSNYAARVHQTPFTFTPYYGAGPVAQTQIVPSYSSTSKFTYLDGATTKFTTGLNATAVTSIMGQSVGTTAAANGPGGATENLISFDAEAIHVFPDGSGFVSDEYGTYIARFNSAKQFTRIIQLPLAAQPHRPADTLNFDSATAPTNGRRNNQGLEGMAVSPNNSRLFALMQSALVQDGGAAQTRFNTRLFVYDIAGANLENPVLIGEYVVQLPRYDLNGNNSGLDATAAQSEIVALSNTQLLMLPRDGNGLGKGTTDPIVAKTVDLVDFSTATNVLGLYDDRGNQISPTGALRVGITPARSTVVVNLLSSADLGKFGFNTNTASPNSFTVNEKAEGMALVPDTSTASSEDYFLFVANDNDFQSSDVRMVDATGNLVSYGDARDRGIVNDAVFTAWRITITPNNRKFFRLDLDTTP